MGGKAHFFLVVAFALMAACASPTQAPADASIDLTAPSCDPGTLFASCSAQCRTPICIVAKATCTASGWTCDCAQAQPCALDMRRAD